MFPMANLAELKDHAAIREVWAALGGGKLRGNRGQAFWRGGDGYSVSLDPEKGVWFDFVTGAGGDVIALVRTVRQCGFLEACQWLGDFSGVRVSEWIRRGDEADTDWPTDLRWASWWRIAAEAMAEESLEHLPYWHPERRVLTDLLSTIRLGDAALVDEYRRWRRRHPEFTSAMAQAGRRSDARVQRQLALWIRRDLDEPRSA
jgi:hypothetical protein